MIFFIVRYLFLFPSLFSLSFCVATTQMNTKLCILKKEYAKKTQQTLKGCKELRFHNKTNMNWLCPCIFFSAQEKLLNNKWTGWSFLCVQNQRSYNLDNIHYSMIFRRFWIILGSALPSAIFRTPRVNFNHLEIPWITVSSLRVSPY